MPIIEELPSDCEDGDEIEQNEPSVCNSTTSKEVAERQKRWEEMEEEEAKRVQKQFDMGESCRIEGNTLMASGRFNEACREYDAGLQHLLLVGNEPENRAKAERANLVFHLNITLSRLRLEEFEEAKESATRALLIEPKNVKALFRRGVAEANLARKASLFQETEAKAACEDFEEALKIDPANSDARRELRQIQKEIRSHEQDVLQGQKQTWGGKLGGRAPSNGEENDLDDRPLAMVRLAVDNSRHMVVSVDTVSLGKLLTGVDLELREKWCVGLYTKDDTAKAMLVNILKRSKRPTSGNLRYPKKPKSGVREDQQIVVNNTLFSAILALSIALLVGLAKSDPGWPIVIVVVIAILSVLALALVLWLEYRQKNAPPIVLHMQSRSSTCWKAFGRSTVLSLLIDAFPQIVAKSDRPSRAKAMLRAAGLAYEDTHLFRELPDQSKQLIYILRSFASRPPVLLCDDALEGLDIACKARVLRMLRRLKQECNTSVLYFSSDFRELSVASDSLGMLSNGTLCELGPSKEVLECPRHPDTKEAIAEFRRMMTGNPETSTLQYHFNELLSDVALGAMWLPKM